MSGAPRRAAATTSKLLATLRTDGSPAPFPGGSRSMFAALEDQPAAAPARPQAFAFLGAQRYEEPEAPAPRAPAEPAYSPRPSRTEVAAVAPEPESRVAFGVPLPPERPFDLGTIPNAGAPVPVAALAPIPPSRPVFAGAVLRAAAAAAGAVREGGSVPGHEAAALRRP